MKPLEQVIVENNPTIKPVWFMRQAGHYLPEFRDIRSMNQDFIKLCLNENLVPEITTLFFVALIDFKRSE